MRAMQYSSDSDEQNDEFVDYLPSQMRLIAAKIVLSADDSIAEFFSKHKYESWGRYHAPFIVTLQPIPVKFETPQGQPLMAAVDLHKKELFSSMKFGGYHYIDFETVFSDKTLSYFPKNVPLNSCIGRIYGSTPTLSLIRLVAFALDKKPHEIELSVKGGNPLKPGQRFANCLTADNPIIVVTVTGNANVQTQTSKATPNTALNTPSPSATSAASG